MLLQDILGEEYALWFYAHMGVLHALEENNCLRVKSCSGSSAGALVAGFLASGMKPTDMPDRVFAIKRENMWDVGFGLGLLKGQLFHQILEDQFPVSTFEECPIPLGVTAYDVLGFKTNCITTGGLATAVRASCTFPGLFQPVTIDNRLHIDGGVWDDGGLMALPSVPASNLIVNVVCGRGRIGSSILPDRFKNARLLTLVLDNIVSVSPFSMENDGPLAFSMARAATFKMLQNGHLQQLSHNHWCAYIDGSCADLTVPLTPLPPRAHSLSNMNLQQQGEGANGVDRALPRHQSFQFHDKSWDSISGGSNEFGTSSSSSNFGNIYSSSSSSSSGNSTNVSDTVPINDSHVKLTAPTRVTEVPPTATVPTRTLDLISGHVLHNDPSPAIPDTVPFEQNMSETKTKTEDKPVEPKRRPNKRTFSPCKSETETVSKIPKTPKSVKKNLEAKKHSARLEINTLSKILKRERKPSFKLAD